MDRVLPYDHSPSKCDCYKETSVCVSWGLSCDSVEGDKETGQVEVKMSLLL